MAEQKFSLERFESLIARRAYEPSAQELLRLLQELDASHGWIIESADAQEIPRVEPEILLARIVAGISTLFSDPAFQFTEDGFRRFVHFHRWINALFGASAFRTSDHIIRAFSTEPDIRETIRIDDQNLYKLALLYSLDSAIPLQPEVLWEKNKTLATTMFFGLLSSRAVISQAAHEKREMLLEWLPPRLEELDLASIPASYFHDVWMHCSYAATPRKHQIKKAINRLIRRWILGAGLGQFERSRPAPPRDKPRLVIVVDWFHSRHVVYTVFSKLLAPLKERFHVTALELHDNMDDTAAALFDEVVCHRLGSGMPLANQLGRLMQFVGEREPDAVFYLGVGMSLTGIFLANTRLAPIQMASHAHPASTQTETIDYFLLEEYYQRAASDFSERLVLLPGEMFALRPPTDLRPIADRPQQNAVVNVALVATVMKLNPELLRACQRIRDRSRVPVRFHVLVGYTGGVAYLYAAHHVHSFLPDAVVYEQMNRASYLDTIAACDMFVDPFPFGNANTMVDCLGCGLPGVTLRGDQIFGHMGAVTMQRMGLDPSFIADSVEQYVEIGAALASEPELRQRVRSYLQSIMVPERIGEIGLFRGKPELLTETLWLLCQQHARAGVQAGASS